MIRRSSIARVSAACLSLCLLAPGVAAADPQPFDLSGPTLMITVAHDGVTLPISQIPNLAAGDKLSIKANLPDDQSARYLLVAGFLRGATNPPSEKWFARAETWDRKGRDALKITVPAGAQQVILFLAPQTGGDFKTLVSAVRGRPGAFVRASQDLNQASLDRSRLDAFLDGIRRTDPADPGRLERVSPLLARSLAIKLNADCLLKLPDQQATCLTQGRDSLVLADGHSTSISETLIGNPTDLALQLASTPQGGLGYYSPYIGVVRDIIRILGGFHTADYQYIPALATLRDTSLALLLNAAPSFHKPQSVMVTALPAIAPPQSPPLRAAATPAGSCVTRPGLVLPVEGAPLVYSTHFAHDMALRVPTRDGKTIDLPAVANGEKGGFVVDTAAAAAAGVPDMADGTLHGLWGFQPFDGPHFTVQSAHGEPWRIGEDDQQSLVIGREGTLSLRGVATACVESVQLRDDTGATQPVAWKATRPDLLTVTLPLAEASPGPLTLLIGRYGSTDTASVPFTVYAETSHIDSVAVHAGDASAVLTGNRLDQVAGVAIGGIEFTPGPLTRVGGNDQLTLAARDPQAAAQLKTGQTKTAKVKLKDGHSVGLKTVVGAPRPSVTLIAKDIKRPPAASPIVIRLTDADALPHDARLTFSIRAATGTRFTGHETIEVATADGAASTVLTTASGLTLEDARVALGTLDPAKAFTTSAFGPLLFRIVQDTTPGDWQPLATLVRMPMLTGLSCGKAAEKAPRRCSLSGSGLFLINAVSAEADGDRGIVVPEGFTGATLQVPRPGDGRLYLKLRDDPGAVAQAIMP